MYSLLLWSLVTGLLPGRDFTPIDHSVDQLRLCSLSDPADDRCDTLMDAVLSDGQVWVLYKYSGYFRVQAFDTSTGAWGASATSTTILKPDTRTGSAEECGINSAQIAACAPQSVLLGQLTRSGGNRYTTGQIGVNPASIVVSGTGGSCPFVTVRAGSFRSGYRDGTTLSTDTFELDRTGSCTRFRASYSYTNCSLDYTSADAYRCEMAVDPDGDSGVEYGACRYFMVYEANGSTGSGCSKPLNRAFLLAHAQSIDGVWKRFLPSGATLPSGVDLRLQNNSAHEGSRPDRGSFVSVPSLIYDPNDSLWRMWFVTEDSDPLTPIRYSESDDDGLNWTIGGAGCAEADYECTGSTDCWDSSLGTFDPLACQAQTWSLAPPDDPYDTPHRYPDALDPEVLVLNADADKALELGMMFTGADRACSPDPKLGVQLWALHQDYGDQSSAAWAWDSSVDADTTDGVVLDYDTSSCPTGVSELVLDPEIVRVAAGKYVMFYNAGGGIYVAGGGFACSDGVDNDNGGGVDYPDDPGCVSPTDDGE